MTKKANEYIGYPRDELEVYKKECMDNIANWTRHIEDEKDKMAKLEEAIKIAANSTVSKVAEIRKGYAMQDMGDGCHTYGKKKVYHYELSIFNVLFNKQMNNPVKQKIFSVRLPLLPSSDNLWQMVMKLRENNVTTLFVSKDCVEFVDTFKLMLQGIEIRELVK